MGKRVRILSRKLLNRIRANSLAGKFSLVIGTATLVLGVCFVILFQLYGFSPLREQWIENRVSNVRFIESLWQESPEIVNQGLRNYMVGEANIFATTGIASGIVQQNELREISSTDGVLYRLQTAFEEQFGNANISTFAESTDTNNAFWVIFSSSTETADDLAIRFYVSFPELRTLNLVLIAIVVSVFATAITALYGMNRISRPMTQLAYATQSFRGVSGYVPLPETGSDELVLLARSFNDMAEEISALISNRTTITAGLSHDLRTPLTRMRLALELLPEDTDPNLLKAFEENLQHMNSLISDAALFAKGEQERPQKVNFQELIQSIVHTVDDAIGVEWFGTPPVRFHTAPNALHRCVSNLVQNAIQYGKNVRVQVRVTSDDAEVHVLDDGPGIPVSERQRVLQPFVRLDKSRNLETGGSGLGLAVVNQLCLIHNWSLTIGSSPSGGTDVAITIPTKISKDILRGTSDLAVQERLADVK